MGTFIIYALHHVDSTKVYIGQSSVGMRRPKKHRYASAQQRRPLYSWVRKYPDYEITILEEVLRKQDLNESERFHIAYFRSIGAALLNCTDGGEGLFSPSEETRKKMSQSLRGKKRSPEVCARMREAWKTRPPITEETRQKMRAASTGRKHSAETIAKFKILNKGRSISPEHREKISKANSGRVVSAITRMKLSLAGKNRYKNKELLS